jgi:hypothetical protein
MEPKGNGLLHGSDFALEKSKLTKSGKRANRNLRAD